VVTFAHDAAVEMPPTRNPRFEVFDTQPDPTYTDIAGALRLAAGIIPDGYARQLVLVSDGRQNLGDAAATIAALRAEGIRVDVLAVGAAPAAEVLVASVDAPGELRVGEHGIATVRLRSTGPATGQLVFSADGKQLETRAVTLPAGISTVTFNLPDFDTGLHKVRAELVTVSPDTYGDNNVGEAAIRVLGRPAVLVLEGGPGVGDNLVAALTASGVKVDRRLAAQAPVDTNVLGRYDTVVVADAPADAFPAGALDAIEATVRDLGHGLVTIGGSNSYGPGGWQNTGLERALPVRMDLPPRKEKPRVAVVLMLETTEVGALDQIVTTGAAEAVIDGLGPDDQVAVTDNQQGFIVPMQHVTDKKAIDALLEKATLGDGPYLRYFQLAGDALVKTDAPLKHIVILGDGDEIHGDAATYQDLDPELPAAGDHDLGGRHQHPRRRRLHEQHAGLRPLGRRPLLRGGQHRPGAPALPQREPGGAPAVVRDDALLPPGDGGRRPPRGRSPGRLPGARRLRRDHAQAGRRGVLHEPEGRPRAGRLAVRPRPLGGLDERRPGPMDGGIPAERRLRQALHPDGRLDAPDRGWRCAPDRGQGDGATVSSSPSPGPPGSTAPTSRSASSPPTSRAPT